MAHADGVTDKALRSLGTGTTYTSEDAGSAGTGTGNVVSPVGRRVSNTGASGNHTSVPMPVPQTMTSPQVSTRSSKAWA